MKLQLAMSTFKVLAFLVMISVVCGHPQIRDDHGHMVNNEVTRHHYLNHHRDHSHLANFGYGHVRGDRRSRLYDHHGGRDDNYDY